MTRGDDVHAAEAGEYLSFSIAGTDYGIPILKVKEILQHEGVTRVPGTPPSIRGIMNVRGSVVPVVDLGVKLGSREAPDTRRTCVLVVEARIGGEALVLGVLGEAVNEVVVLSAADVEAPPALGAGVRLDWLTGMGKAGKGFVLLLDVDRALSPTEAEAVAAAMEGAASLEGPAEGEARAGGERRA